VGRARVSCTTSAGAGGERCSYLRERARCFHHRTLAEDRLSELYGLQCIPKRGQQLSPKPVVPETRGGGVRRVYRINETRADEPLLRLLFESFPQYQFLFVGYTDNPGFVQRLTRCPNVAFVPEIPYKQLPDLIRGFDVAIVPHQDNAVTRGNDLLKVLDYLACGVPVVSTRCSNVEEYAGALYVADSSERFIEQVKELVERRLHDPVPGYAIARSRDWASQVPTLAAQLFAPLPTTNASREVLSI
jgi:hypothetical protein